VVERIEHALQSGEPLLIALQPAPPPAPEVPPDALPDRLRDVQVASARAADFDALLGGVR
jgi:hypothetical protein